MKRVPNILTLIRLFLIPLYLTVFYSDTAHPVRWAMIIFLVASLTDIIDGYIARKYDAITKFGQVADPFADKVMQLSVLYTLMDIGYIENWFFLIVLIKDGLQIFLGVALLNVEPKIIVPANVFGKATTVLIFATILLSLFRLPGLIYLQLFVGGLAVFTFSQYAYHVWQAWEKNKSAKTDNQ